MTIKEIKQNQANWAISKQNRELTPLIESELITDLKANNIKRICELRHNIHAGRTEEHIYNLESWNHQSVLDNISELESLIQQTVFTGDEPSSFDITYDVIHDDYEGEEDEEDYMYWSYSFIRERIEKLNSLAEEFLRNFDEEHETNIAPTGALRGLI